MGRRKITSAERQRRHEFGRLLKERREFLGLSLGQAARDAGLEHSTLSRIESGERPAPPECLDALEKAYKVPRLALQLKLSSQLSLPLKHVLLQPLAEADGDATASFSVKVTAQERRELVLFLGYLRFKEAGRRSSEIAKVPVTEPK